MNTLFLKLIALQVATAVFASAFAAELIVVSPKHEGVSLDRAALEDIFLGKRTTWPDGSRIEVVSLADGAVHEAFLKRYLQKTPSQFAVYWKKVVFTGKGRPPTVAEDDQAVVKLLGANPDAIGYIGDASLDPAVKALTIK